MKRSFSNATLADAVVVVEDAKASIVDAMPAEMFCEITYRLPDLASLLCLAGTCKFAFVSVFRACNAWDYALPEDWDGESIVPVAFFGQFLDAIKDTRKVDHDRMVKYILRRDDKGKMPNACKWLPDFMRNLVLGGRPVDGEEDSLLVFMRDHLTPELVEYLTAEGTQHTSNTWRTPFYLDPMYHAVVNLNSRAFEILVTWAQTRDGLPYVGFSQHSWELAQKRKLKDFGIHVDNLWREKGIGSRSEAQEFLYDVIDFSVATKCPKLVAYVDLFWEVLLMEMVTLDDIQQLGPLALPPLTWPIEIPFSQENAAYVEAKIDHFKKHVCPSLEVTYVPVGSVEIFFF
jgi:hypothetical protein